MAVGIFNVGIAIETPVFWHETAGIANGSWAKKLFHAGTEKSGSITITVTELESNYYYATFTPNIAGVWTVALDPGSGPPYMEGYVVLDFEDLGIQQGVVEAAIIAQEPLDVTVVGTSTDSGISTADLREAVRFVLKEQAVSQIEEELRRQGIRLSDAITDLGRRINGY